MTQLLERLHEDHMHLTRLLDLLERLLDMFHEGTEPDYELICEMLEYMEQYADQLHHPTEELIFERMRTYDAGQQQILDVLTNQHEVLGEINKQFRASMESIIQGDVIRRDLVEAHGRDLVQTLRNHLDLEEKDAFPLAQELLSDDDWNELQKQAPKASDPVFGEHDRDRFQALYRHLLAQTLA